MNLANIIYLNLEMAYLASCQHAFTSLEHMAAWNSIAADWDGCYDALCSIITVS